jgi:hypothetical protein
MKEERYGVKDLLGPTLGCKVSLFLSLSVVTVMAPLHRVTLLRLLGEKSVE